jgi:putative flippase GtrA
MLTFLKAQAASFLITILLVELTGAGPVPASVEGNISGGIINFIINRTWVFGDGEKKVHIQVLRYILVWWGNLALSALGMYLFTHYTNINYVVAKIFVSMVLGIFYNYFLQKRFVFK